MQRAKARTPPSQTLALLEVETEESTESLPYRHTGVIYWFRCRSGGCGFWWLALAESSVHTVLWPHWHQRAGLPGRAAVYALSASMQDENTHSPVGWQERSHSHHGCILNHVVFVFVMLCNFAIWIWLHSKICYSLHTYWCSVLSVMYGQTLTQIGLCKIITFFGWWLRFSLYIFPVICPPKTRHFFKGFLFFHSDQGWKASEMAFIPRWVRGTPLKSRLMKPLQGRPLLKAGWPAALWRNWTGCPRKWNFIAGFTACFGGEASIISAADDGEWLLPNIQLQLRVLPGNQYRALTLSHYKLSHQSRRKSWGWICA